MKLRQYTIDRLRLAQRIAQRWEETDDTFKFLVVLIFTIYAAVILVAMEVSP